ncbi:MAG TPA: UDP-N-acetylmuramoyl-L-alanyl-D-glutamate--2,6-diaminopimelate ligase [Candidatus Polarisedimenticolia bacterium]|nr:UDP-N-acetylmuramoyl-L-alanyl-D-glutamate--2,6-diaminopimelate ligase [Candidatus Polarisedimenticolia bacterium]
MRLSELFDGPREGQNIAMSAAVDIRGLSADSRQVEQGFVFAALPGARTDGRRYIDQAVAKGAVAVLAEPATAVPAGTVLLVDPNPRRRLALMAAIFYGRQPRHIAAITGTSGKTSTAEFTRQLWAALGRSAASLGTLGIVAPANTEYLPLTTLDPVELHRRLAEIARDGVDHLAMEASSHGLDQFRLDGVKVTSAAFTNLSRDHLDYHGTGEAYLAAKRRLFSEVMEPGHVAVLNADAPEFENLAAACRAHDHRIIRFGRNSGDLRLVSQRPDGEGQQLALEVFGKRANVFFPVAGSFQAENLLAALGLVIADGESAEAALGAVAKLRGVHGRIEHVATHPNGAPIYVDYAHKPAALEAVLTALRPHAKGKLSVVFGCGGDRDRGKRPQMGEIAERLADRVIVTDDNPRSEDPAAIRAEIMAATKHAREIGDRHQAIRTAINELGPDDLLVIAGKGHETGQTAAGVTHPFDDSEEARAAMRDLAGGSV